MSCLGISCELCDFMEFINSAVLLDLKMLECRSFGAVVAILYYLIPIVSYRVLS